MCKGLTRSDIKKTGWKGPKGQGKLKSLHIFLMVFPEIENELGSEIDSRASQNDFKISCS